MGTFFHAYTQADFFGKLIFFTLFLLSSFSWVFLIQKILMIKQMKQKSKRFQCLAENHKDKILDLKVRSHNPFTSLYQSFKEKTVQILDKNHYFSSETGENQHYLSRADMEFITSHISIAIAKQKGKLEKNLFFLATTVTLAPFLGLLGTVWGILITFGELQMGHSASNSVILGGLSTALTTTVLGLLIAIPALMAHSYLKNLSRYFTMEMQNFSHFLLSTIELQYRKVDFS